MKSQDNKGIATLKPEDCELHNFRCCFDTWSRMDHDMLCIRWVYIVGVLLPTFWRLAVCFIDTRQVLLFTNVYFVFWQVDILIKCLKILQYTWVSELVEG